MQGLRIGHYTDFKQKTGASIFIFDKPAVGSYCLCGAAPATRELETLSLDANVSHINGLALLGGSALGLGAVDGMQQWFQEQGVGWGTSDVRVPIVPAAAIYDLAIGSRAAPTKKDVYTACQQAYADNKESGLVGCGTGASIGKLVASAMRMTGGIGHASVQLENGVEVLVYAVVNSVGDIYNNSGQIIAGARLENGIFANCQQTLFKGFDETIITSSNTTLVALFTDAAFSKIELHRIVKMATAGMARAIAPVFTRYDGDIVFGFSLGKKVATELMIGNVAAEITRLAIVNAVQNSVVLSI